MTDKMREALERIIPTEEDMGRAMAYEDRIASLCVTPEWDDLSEGRRESLRRHARAVLALLRTRKETVEVKPSTWRKSRAEWFALPLKLRQRWWAETETSSKEPSEELMQAINLALLRTGEQT